jgi:hypothetical protein
MAMNDLLKPRNLLLAACLGAAAGACTINDDDGTDTKGDNGDGDACHEECHSAHLDCSGHCDDNDNTCIGQCDLDQSNCEKDCD